VLALREAAAYLKNRESDEFNKSAFEPQNVEQGISNFEVLVYTSAVRNSIFDILSFRYSCIAYRDSE
jgi:hypothetical protein